MGKWAVGLREKEKHLERKYEQADKSDHQEDIASKTIQGNSFSIQSRESEYLTVL